MRNDDIKRRFGSDESFDDSEENFVKIGNWAVIIDDNKLILHLAAFPSEVNDGYISIFGFRIKVGKGVGLNDTLSFMMKNKINFSYNKEYSDEENIYVINEYRDEFFFERKGEDFYLSKVFSVFI